MSLRYWLCVVLVFTTAAAMGQALDLSGIWLQEKPTDSDPELAEPAPIVMEIRQTPTEIFITSYQNGAQLAIQFELSGQPTTREPGGYNPRLDRVKIKGGKLVVDSLIPPKAKDSPYGFQVKLNETWELSPDAHVLTIQRNIPSANREVHQETETYQRQNSLDAALQLSEINSEMNRCVTEPANPFAVEMARSPQFKRLDENRRNRKKPTTQLSQKSVLFNGAAALGGANLRQLEQCTSFKAVVAGDFLKGLQRTPNSDGFSFTKDAKDVTTYPDNIILDVEPSVWNCPGWWVTTPIPSLSPDALQLFPLPPQMQDLRFDLVWKGSRRLELGEVPSELKTEPFTELDRADPFFRLHVPSKDVLLTDSLEIHVLSKAGKQLACIQGHI